MCNGKGWDIAFWPDDEITVEQHFCRVLGDCRHVDNTLEEAADQVADEYRRIRDWYKKECVDGYIVAKVNFMDSQYKAWKNRTHPSYLFYKSEE